MTPSLPDNRLHFHMTDLLAAQHAEIAGSRASVVVYNEKPIENY
jgi:hypothetical protein